jgi:hypothetical protein
MSVHVIDLGYEEDLRFRTNCKRLELDYLSCLYFVTRQTEIAPMLDEDSSYLPERLTAENNFEWELSQAACRALKKSAEEFSVTHAEAAEMAREDLCQ